MGDYDDIIHLPHHQSKTRPHMSMTERAAQFSPFAALTGYEDVLEETARLTDQRSEPSESEQAELDRQLQLLQERISERPVVSITYFQPDEKKSGGAYVTVTDAVRRIDTVKRVLVLMDGREIPINDVSSIEFVE